METNPLAEDIAPLRQLLEKKLGIRGRSFAVQVQKARRKLPARARAQAARIIETEALAAHPKLAPQADVSAARTAAKELTSYLKSIDAMDRHRGALVGWASAFSANFLVAALIAATIWALLK